MIHPSFLMALGIVLGEIQRGVENNIILTASVIVSAVTGAFSCVKNRHDSSKIKKILVSVTVFFMFFIIGYICFDNKCEEYERWSCFEDGETYEISGRIVSFEKKKNSMSMIVNCRDYGKIILFFYDENMADYSYINSECVLTVEYKKLENARNYGNYDEEEYYKSLGIGAKGICKNIEVVKKNVTLLGRLYGFRMKMNDILITCAGEKHGSVLSAMTLGTKSLMDEETKDLYSRNGLSHITAISGMHIGVVGMCLFGVLRKLFGVTPASFITGGAMLLYGIITGASVSCVRAVVMFLVKLGGIVTGRRYSPSVSVAVSMVLILLGNPCYIYNSSFIMSYAAIISVLIIFPVVNYHIKNMIKRSRYAYIKNLKKSVAAVVGSLCLNVVMLPLMSFYFYKVPVYSVLINILVVPLMSMVLFSSIICCGLYCFLGGTAGYAEMIGTGVVMVGKVLLIVFEKLCNIFEFLPFNIYVSGKPQIGEVLFFYGTVAVIIILLWAIRVYMRRKQLTMDRVFGRVVLSAVALMLFISVRNILVNKHVTGNGLFISFIDVGQGDCVFIRDSKGVTYLYDCGSSDEECVGKYMVVPHLRSLGVDNIDYVIVSHGDTDHVSGIKEMLSDRYLMDIGCLIVGKLQAQSDAVRELVALAEKKDIRVVYAGKGFVIRSGELFLECIGPAAENKRIATTEAVESSNESSLVMVCTYKDFKLILTGDIGAETEKILLEDKNIADKIANADVLKVAHHGSAYSSSAEFLDKVLPQVAVISCGIDNSYGHPASIVVDRLLRNEAKLFLTMESGTIWMKEVEGKIVVGRYRK